MYFDFYPRQLDHPNVIRILDIVCPNLDFENPALFSFMKHDNSLDAIRKKKLRADGVVGTTSDTDINELYLVFEFVDTDLYKLILSAQYLTMPHIKTFLYQLLIGLKYIHSANVVHRDIKPANILVNEDCTLKVCGAQTGLFFMD